jgi:ubiquinone/menaquinone biosynthesis C-methylase UbiE
VGDPVRRSRVCFVKRIAERFDSQAAEFDRRAGLEPAQCRQIAATVLALGNVGANDVIVEIGAGTGQIGVELAAARRYVGCDLSTGMLQRFRARSRESATPCALVRADAGAAWPLVSGSCRAVFGSRALHLLAHEHVADEAFRVGRPDGATLIIGRVERSPESVKARLAREMRGRLRRRGFTPRSERYDSHLIKACGQRGGMPLEPVTAVTWTVSASARQSLDAWRSLSGLGGIHVPSGVREVVLRELDEWASDMFGGLDREFASEEACVLRAVRLFSPQ